MTTAAAETREVFAFPASFAQRRLWFLHQLEPEGTAYVMQAPYSIAGVIDSEALAWTLNEIVRRHESLRTTFALVDGEPLQLVAPELDLPLERIDVSSLPPPQRQAAAQRIARERAMAPFDLERGPLVRAALVRIGDEEHILALAMHHIITDGWSLAVLMREASMLYASFVAGKRASLPELPIQYADYSVWQREWLQGSVLDEQVGYWKARLDGAPAALELPLDRPRGTAQTSRGAQHPVRVDAALTDALRALARRRGATLYMALLALFQALLHRYTGQDDICVGTPIAGRTRSETEDLIGFFVNTLVMRGDVSGRPHFLALLDRVKETTLGAYAHQDVPFERIVEAIAPERDATRTPLFQVLFILQNAPQQRFELATATVRQLPVESPGAKFDLTLALEEQEDGSLEGYIEYNADLFEASTIVRLGDHFCRLLASAVAEPERPLAMLPMLSEAQRRQLLTAWNGVTRYVPLTRCLPELFEEHAARSPETLAVAGEDGRLTRAELNARANRLARLLRARGIGPESRVAILAEPSAAMATAVLGVLKAGGAYVPIDPAFPADRIAYILENSGVPIVLTTRALSSLARAAETILLDAPLEGDGANLPPLAGVGNAAYTIYTSGSTGRPKGVVVEHRQLLNYLFGIADRFGLEEGMSYAMLQPLAVDACNTVLIPALCHGGTLHALPRERAADPFALADYFTRERMDVLKIAPSHLAALLDASTSPALMPRRVLALGGEGSRWTWLRDRVASRVHDGSRVFIHYGPTETTVGMLTHRVENEADPRGALAPLGSPLPNTRAYVLDAAMQLVPIGVAGEIFIGGACVARGYLDRPDLTAERFVPDPFSDVPGARLYRTGDLARWLPEGVIQFLGRTDYQVKIRGFRIELGEIESALLEHRGVDRAVAIARDDDRDGKRLVAYVTPKDLHDDRAALVRALRAMLRRRLPDYMTPSAIVVLDAMPLTAQGKVDLRALPAPVAGGSAPKSGATLPRTLMEARVAAVWEEVLELRDAGVDDDFFQAGGHSLLAVRMLAAIRDRFDRVVSLASFLRNPTIAHLATLLTGTEGDSPVVVALRRGAEGAPFFCVHPIGGNAVCYVPLASALGAPFYAFQTPSANAPATIEAMAELYLRELQRIAPNGPYALGGWSFGGLVAFEMARQLEQRGESLRLLALFDTYPPPREELPIVLRFAADVARMLGREPDPRALPAEGVRQYLLDTLRGEGFPAEEMLATFERNALAADRYRLSPIEQPIELFLAAEGQGVSTLPKEWAAWTRGGVRHHVVDGDHYTMLQRPHVQRLAEHLITGGLS